MHHGAQGSACSSTNLAFSGCSTAICPRIGSSRLMNLAFCQHQYAQRYPCPRPAKSQRFLSPSSPECWGKPSKKHRWGCELEDSWSCPQNSITDFVMSFQDSTTFFLATVSGGVFKSVDGGENWRAVSSGLTSLYVQTLAIHPRN